MQGMKRSLPYRPLLDAPSLIRPSSQTTLTVRDTLTILKTAAKTKALNLGKVIHATLITSNPFFNYQVIENNALLNVYAKCGQHLLVQHLFGEMRKRNVVSWSTLMSSYFHNGYVTRVLELFKVMLNLNNDPRPNKYILSIVLSCCSEGRLLIEGQQCHGYVMKSGMEFHQYVKNALLSMYSMCSDVDRTMKVFDHVPGLDIFSFNCVVTGFLDNGCAMEALDVMWRMVEERVEWDNTTYVNIVRVSARLKDLTFGRQVHSRLLRHNIEVDLFVGSAVIDMYGKCGDILSAIRVFDGLTTRNVVSWTAILAAYLQNDCFEDALKLFLQMEVEGVLPNEYTFVVLLKSCAGLSAIGCGDSLHARVEKAGYAADTIVGNALIYMYSRSARIEAARVIFKNMVKRDSITWNSMISGYAYHGLGKEALSVFYDMLASKEPPNYVTFVGVLSACGHLGRVEEGFHYLHNLMRDKGIEPGLEHYTCIVGLLGKAGRLEEAKDFMMSTPVKWDIVAWRTLLNACHVHCHYGLGNQVAELILEMNPEDVETCIILSNMHAKAKRWDGVVKIRKLMRGKNIKKEPGMSWTEIKNMTHVFVSDDNKHPETDQIHQKVSKLLTEIKPLGYTPNLASALHDVEEEQKENSLRYHSEKLAIAFALLKTPEGSPIRILKNLRMCDDCHSAVKLISKVTNREIIVRDANRFHSFQYGICSCADYW